MKKLLLNSWAYIKAHKKQIIGTAITVALVYANEKYDVVDDEVIKISDYQKHDAKSEAVRALSRIAESSYSTNTKTQIATQIANIVK